MARPKRRAHPNRKLVLKGSSAEEKEKAQRALRVKEANTRWEAYQAQFTYDREDSGLVEISETP